MNCKLVISALMGALFLTPAPRCQAQQTPITSVTLTGTVDYETLRQTVDDNPSLHTLDLSATDITTLPAYSLAASSIEELILPSRLETIGAGALAGTRLQHITLPLTVTVIAPYAFSGCDALQSIDGGEALRVIGDGAMRRCPALKEIQFPATLDSIGAYALRGSALTTLDLRHCTQLRTIGDWAFADCSSIETVAVPSNLTHIGRGAFFGDGSIKEVALSAETLNRIDDFAFAYAVSLTDVNASTLTTVPDLGIDTWHGVDQQSATLTVLNTLLDSFASTPGWQEFNIVGIASIDNVEADCRRLTVAFAGDILNITATTPVRSVAVYGTDGRLGLTANLVGCDSPYTVDASPLVAGIYIVAVGFDDGSIKAVKARK